MTPWIKCQKENDFLGIFIIENKFKINFYDQNSINIVLDVYDCLLKEDDKDFERLKQRLYIILRSYNWKYNII